MQHAAIIAGILARWNACNFCSVLHAIIIDRVAGEIIRLVAFVCVRVCPFAVGALLFEPFDL